MKCEKCGTEMLFIYRGIWVNERTQITPEPICPNINCAQGNRPQDLLK